jgi:DNA polymerase-3 subunit delta
MARLAPDRFLERLAKGKPVAGVALLGGDLYLRDLCREKLVEAWVPEASREWGVARFDAAEVPLGRILQHAQTPPMFAPRQVLFVADLEALEELGEAERDAAVEALAAYLDEPAPFTALVLEAAALDERMKLSKLLAEKTLVVDCALPGDDEKNAPLAVAMTLRMARELGAEIERPAAEELVDRHDATLARIRMELEKLAAYAGERGRITLADVDALVVSGRKHTVWELTEMLASRQRDRALAFLESLLREGEEPAGLVGAMAWMYRTLLQAQELPAGASKYQAMRELRLREPTAEIVLRHARRIPRERLLAGLGALYEADSRLKSGPADPRAVMEFLLAELIGPPATGKAESASPRATS